MYKYNVGDVLQHLYESEINVKLWNEWDAGWFYQIAEGGLFDGVEPVMTDERDVKIAVLTLAEDAANRFPGSSFATTWKQIRGHYIAISE